MSLLTRRLLLPVLAVVCACCALVSASWLLAPSIAPWLAIAVALIACAAVAMIVSDYARRQSRALLNPFETPTPHPADPPIPAPPEAPLETTVQALAASFATLIAESSKGNAQLRTIISSMTEG